MSIGNEGCTKDNPCSKCRSVDKADSLEKVQHDLEMDEMKKIYEANPSDWCRYGFPSLAIDKKYVKILHSDKSWHDYWTYKLIAKKDELIADAVIANPDVEIEYDATGKYWYPLRGTEFFEEYNSEMIYKLKETKPTQINSMEDLNELPIVGEEETDVTDIDVGDIAETTTTAKTISITSDNGTVYSFEKPEFECELLGIDDNEFIIGIVTDTTYSGSANKVAHFWNNDTLECYELDYEAQRKKIYDLTPIKPKWYEDEANFPKAISWNLGKNIYFDIAYGVSSDGNDFVTGGMESIVRVDEARLATKEEVNSLHYEGKDAH